jgi:FAD/FMN-containing dehydrogenase
VGVLHSKLDKVIAVNPMGPYTMTVGAGMDLNKFMAAATRAGMSVQVGSLTAYAGLTLAGILTTSAHGSGYGTVSMLVRVWGGML